MKKLFFTLALILSVVALSAQKYTVTEKESGNVVENGASYYVYGDGAANYGELILDLRITANEDVNLVAEVETIQAVTGTYNSICLDQCYAPGITTTPVVAFAAGESKDFAMHYMYENTMEEVLGQEQIMKYYVHEEGGSEMFIVNVTFKYSLDVIDDYSSAEVFSNAYPMPARDVVNFDYNFATSVVGKVAIFNMMGQEVLRNEINGMSGKASINVSDLADGIYFYSLIINGKTEKSNKLIIRK